MKFSHFKPKNRQVLHIPTPNMGMNLTKPTLHLADGEIGYSENVILKDGILTTRKGLFAESDSVLEDSVRYNFAVRDMEITNTEFVYEGSTMRVAVLKYLNSSREVYTFSVYLLGNEPKSKYIGCFVYEDDLKGKFMAPDSYTFFSGKAQSGVGLFLFLKLKNFYSEKTEYHIYELSDDYLTWNEVADFYTPTVYINGRGNSYEEAKKLYNVSDLSPKSLEMPNLLYNRFYAYYSSDGVSSTFRLPYTKLENSTIECIIHTTPSAYGKWVISPGKTTHTITFNEKSVTMTVNRSKGWVSFTVDDVDFPIKIMKYYTENNIRIGAVVNADSDFENIVSCDCSERIGDKIYFSGGNDKNKLYYCDWDNPLYFPSVSNNEIGACDKKVESIIAFGEDLIAFKKDELYKVKINKGKAINKIALLADNGGIFNEVCEFSVVSISENIGCERIRTIDRLEGKPIWLGNDNTVYIMTKSGELIPLSNKITPLVEGRLYESQKNCVGAFTNEGYIFAVDNMAFVIQYNKEAKCFLWKLPENLSVCGIISLNETTTFLLENESANDYFTAILKGNSDVVYTSREELKKLKIPTSLRLKSQYLSPSVSQKFLHTANFQISLKENSKIILGDTNQTEEFIIRKGEFSSGGSDLIKLLVNLRGIDSVDIKLESEGAINFVYADIFFSESSDGI